MRFLSEYSHDIYCWAVALVVCGGCLLFMLIIDMYWTKAYKQGYEKGYSDGSNSQEIS